MADKEIALLLYGFGAELGNFRFFADDTAAELTRLKKFASADIVIKQTVDRASFAAALSDVPAGQKIKELHVYPHSIGGACMSGTTSRPPPQFAKLPSVASSARPPRSTTTRFWTRRSVGSYRITCFEIP